MVFLLIILDILYTHIDSFISEKYEVTNLSSFTLLYKISYWLVEKCITYRPYLFWVSLLMLWNVVSYFWSTIHILKILLRLTILNNLLRFNKGILNGIPLGDTGYPLHPNKILLMILWALSETRLGGKTPT